LTQTSSECCWPGGIVAWEERHGVGELSRRGKQDGLKTVQL
jgi:hypothetical protein